MPARAPNLLFLMFDQMAPQFLPLYGHALVKAPCLEELSRSGTVFENAYCNSPLCAPSRFSMMAGQLPSRIGAYDNAAAFGADVPTFAHYLRAEGYRTCLSGKMHFVGPDQLHGFEERLTTDVYPADFGWTPDWGQSEKRHFWFHNMQSVVEAGVYARTLNLDYDEEVAYQAVRYLYDAARDADRRPLFLTVSFIQPHDPYMTPQAQWDLYDHDEIDLPAIAALPRAEKDPHSRRLHYTCHMDQYRISESHVRNARHAYYGMISDVDAKAAMLMRALRETGLLDSTVIVATADHGDMLGERGLWYKMTFFEHAARVPLIMSGPGIPRGERVVENVSLLDLLPTFHGLASDGRALSPRAPLDGRSVLDLLGGRRTSQTEPVPGEYLAEGVTEPMFMLKDGPYKLIACGADPVQLFDCASDPNERRDLAGSEAVAVVQAKLEAELERRWDADRLREEVIESQQRRLFIHDTFRLGRRPVWDFEPRRDASRLYNRNLADELYDTDRQARIPRRDPPPFDGPEESR